MVLSRKIQIKIFTPQIFNEYERKQVNFFHLLDRKWDNKINWIFI